MSRAHRIAVDGFFEEVAARDALAQVFAVMAALELVLSLVVWLIDTKRQHAERGQPDLSRRHRRPIGKQPNTGEPRVARLR